MGAFSYPRIRNVPFPFSEKCRIILGCLIGTGSFNRLLSPRMETPVPLVITRTFDAPKEAVFQYWSDPEKFKKWWGPKDYVCNFCRLNFKTGGRYLVSMTSPEGADVWSAGTYRSVVPNEKIVETDSFADENGTVVPASFYGMEGDWPIEFLVTVTFEDVGGKTKMTLTHE